MALSNRFPLRFPAMQAPGRGPRLSSLLTSALRAMPRFVWIMIAVSGWLLFASILLLTERTGSTAGDHKRIATTHPSTAPNDAIETMRRLASGLDAADELLLAQSLLDRYEKTGRVDLLLEAVLWWRESSDGSDHLKFDMANRLFQRHCNQPSLYWLPLCNPGE